MTISRRRANVSVTINGVVEPEARVLEINLGLGGGGVNTCTFEVLGTTTDIVSAENNNLESIAGQNQLVEITMDTGAPLFLSSLVFRGRVCGARIELGPDGEKIVYKARLDDPMFSKVNTEKPQYSTQDFLGDSSDSSTFYLLYSEDEMVFNPIVNGTPMPNKTAFELVAPWVGKHVFIDPRSVDPNILTATIRDRSDEYQVVTNPVDISPDSPMCDYWCLREIVDFLCQHLGLAGNVNAPTQATIDSLPEDGTMIRNLKIRRGAYLTEALDAVLKPYGYYWLINFNALGGPTIEIYERGLAPASVAYSRQLSGNTVDGSETVWSYNLDYDISPKTAGTSFCYGSPVIKEGTFELMPAWDISAADAIEDDDTLGSVPDAAGDDGAVWRKWVLNEAGDYTGLNSGSWYALQDWDSSTRDFDMFPFDWSDFFGADVTDSSSLVRRRTRLLPTVTLNKAGNAPQGQKGGVFLEYGTYADGKWTWRPVDSLTEPKSDINNDASQNQRGGPGLNVTWRLLENEAGIMFDEVPLSLKARANADTSGLAYHPRIRVTASLSSDQRVLGLGSTNILPVDAYFNAADVTQFRKKVVATTGDYTSVLWRGVDGEAGGFTGDDAYKDGRVDDSAAAGLYAQDIVDKFSQATVSGSVVTPFISSNFSGSLGLTLQSISGMDFVMRTNSELNTPATYPTITRVRFDFQAQTSTVTLGSP